MEKSIKSHRGQGPVEVILEIKCGLSTELSKPQQKKGKFRAYEMTSVLTVTSDNTFVDYRRISCVRPRGPPVDSNAPCRTRSLKDAKTFTVFAELTKPSQSLVTIIGSVRAGLIVSVSSLTRCRKRLLGTPSRSISDLIFLGMNTLP